MIRIPTGTVLSPAANRNMLISCWLISTALLPWAAVASGPTPACELEARDPNGGGRLSATTRDTWTWQAQPGDVVRCDLEAHEPLDAECLEASCLGGEPSLRLLPGRSVELTGPRPEGPIEVEWRRFGAPGEPSERIARRLLTPPVASEPWLLYSAIEEGRLLRLRRQGGSPETFFVPAISPESPETNTQPWLQHPRWPFTGGEIFGFAEAEDFRPVALLLDRDGAVEELTPGAWGQFGAAGLQPGRFRLRALFRGGWQLEGPSILVEEEETAEILPWVLPRSGAVELEIEPDLCAETTEAGFLVLESRRRGAQRLELEPGDCNHRLEGLPPGEWTISIDRAAPPPNPAPTAMRRGTRSGPTASVTVAVEAGAVSAATLERPRTWIEGRVIAGGQGLPGVELRLTRSPSRDAELALDDAAIAYADGDGVFRLEAPAPGPAILRLYSESGYPMISRDVELAVGVNRHGFDLGDGRIRAFVSADGAELEGPTTLEVWETGTRRLVRSGTLEADQEETLIYGLDLGSYELSAFTEQGLATLERPQVELSKQWPSEDVELVLEKRRVVATVLDSSGLPVPGLLVAIDQRQLAETGERPGEYSLLGASAGSELRVVPPLSYVPVCRMLERVEPVEIALRPANAHALLIPPPGPLPPAGSFLGALENLPGSNCAMPVSLLWRSVEGADGRPLVRLDGLTAGTFLFRNADGVVIVQVPGPPIPMPGVEELPPVEGLSALD